MNILEEIKNDHDKIRGLMLQVENNEDKALDMFKEMAVTALAHHEAEEHVVFPELPESEKEMRLALIAEHDAIRRSIQVVLGTPEGDENWKARFHVLKDLLYHHVQEEEEKLFETLREEMTPEMLKAVYEPFEKHEETAKTEIQACVDNGMVLSEEDMQPMAKKPAANRPRGGRGGRGKSSR